MGEGWPLMEAWTVYPGGKAYPVVKWVGRVGGA